MTEVLFNNVDEFCEEMKLDSGNRLIDREIVRITNLWKQSGQLPLHLLFIEACYTNGGQIVKLEAFCGEHWGLNNETDEKTLEKARAHQLKVRDLAEALGIEVRAGVLQECDLNIRPRH